MFDLSQLSSFHFLRPLWLLMLIPSILVFVILQRQQGTLKQWKKLIAPHLLNHLIVGAEHKSRFRPIHALLIVCLLVSVALSGPTWKIEPSPFTEDTASLVIALDLSASMNAIDIQPTRLQRAQQKVHDLLLLRKGARTGLIAYSGSAHVVLPPTNDPEIFETYLNALRTDIMPVKGKDPTRALSLAMEIIKRDEAPGTILFITDSISKEYLPFFVEHTHKSRVKILVLGIGTTKGGPILISKNKYLKDKSGLTVVSKLDRDELVALSDKTGAYVTTVTVDDSDVRRINSRIEGHLKSVQSEDENTRWKDFGYYIVIPVALLSLLWFRKGWTIQFAMILVFLAITFQPSTALAGNYSLENLFLTSDQQGRYYFEEGKYEEAAKRFNDPLWKGISFYMNENFEAAINEFVKVHTPEGYFNLGNSYAHNKNYEQAINSYDSALKLKPDYDKTRVNMEIVQALLDKKMKEEDEQKQEGDPTFEADEMKFDEKGEKGKKGDVEQSLFTEEQITEMWMRNIRTSPADFLRIKFAVQITGESK